jgi:hypothetical protein
MPRAPGVIVGEDPALLAALESLACEARLVFLAGLPGTGKSLLIHQLAHLAHTRGRRIHLLQWDVARPIFEASPPGRRYPQIDGVTHGMIRLAVGRWARETVARWHRRHPGFAAILIGETPFVGHRLSELAWPADDDAEPVLAAAWTRFVVPVPSRALRTLLETERARRVREPRHPREREDAPPGVLRDLWQELAAVARALEEPDSLPRRGEAEPYDPALYRRVYERILRGRHAQVVHLDRALPARDVSAYDFRIPTEDLVPTEADAVRLVREVERLHPDPGELERRIAGWHRPP